MAFKYLKVPCLSSFPVEKRAFPRFGRRKCHRERRSRRQWWRRTHGSERPKPAADHRAWAIQASWRGGHVLDMLGKGEQREFTTVVGVVSHGKWLENGWTTLKSVYSSLFATEIVCFLIYWGGVMYASYYPLLCDDIV